MQRFVVQSDEIEGRIDPLFYHPKYLQVIHKLQKSKYEIKRIGDICSRIVDGPFGTQLKVEDYTTEGIPVIRISNVKSGEISENNLVKISLEKHAELKRSRVLPNDVLLTKAGAILGYSAVFPSYLKEGNITSHLVTITCKPEVNPHYLKTFFLSNVGQEQIYRWGNKSTRPELNTEEVRKIFIPIPSLETQNQIVDIMQSAYKQKKQKEAEAQRLLDSIDGYVLDELGIKLPEIKIKKCFLVWNNEVVQRLDPLYYSKDVFSFLKEFSYEVKPLEGITYYLKTGFAAGNSQQEAVNEGIIQIRPTNIDDIGLLRFDKNIYLKKEYLDKKNDDLLQKGEVLFNNTNSQELVGKTSFFDLEGQYFCSNHITRIKVNEDFVSPTYLWIILNIYQKAKIFFNLCTNWNNQSGVNIELLKTVQIPLSPLRIQNKIAEEVKRRISEAKRLKGGASKVIEEAKKQVEEMILGE